MGIPLHSRARYPTAFRAWSPVMANTATTLCSHFPARDKKVKTLFLKLIPIRKGFQNNVDGSPFTPGTHFPPEWTQVVDGY